MADVTRLLEAIENGDPRASEELLPLVYDELRKLARGRMAALSSGQTLQPTALVHDAWLRIEASGPRQWNGRGHFFAAAAEAMRRILVEQARRKSRHRHGGKLKRVDFEEVELASHAPEEKTLLIDEALDRLASEDSLKADIVKLKFFVGLTHDEIANTLDLSEKTVRRHWNSAKIRLLQLIESTHQ